MGKTQKTKPAARKRPKPNRMNAYGTEPGGGASSSEAAATKGSTTGCQVGSARGNTPLAA